MSRVDWRRLLLPPVLRALALTWRWRLDIDAHDAQLIALDRPAVYAFWHGQMFPFWYQLRRLRPAAIVSASRDGGALAALLASLGYRHVFRGSSSRGGRDALHAAVASLAEAPLLITPDGPRGPARQAQPGAVIAALRAGVPLLLCGWRASRSLRFRSWDSMELPLPFAVIHARFRRFPLDGLTPEARVTDELLRELSGQITELSSVQKGHQHANSTSDASTST